MAHSLVALAVFLVTAAEAGHAAPREVTAPGTIHVHDGDTFYVGRQAFRLRGIDTPELGQRGGYEAKRRLVQLLHAGPVTILRRAEDRYGRVLADVRAGGRDVADTLRAEGFAKTVAQKSGRSGVMRGPHRHQGVRQR
jgi:endonuclease YncB( thermonuclease family)